ncbi:MAG: RHS repeat-associated core domain-containing protein, partial [Eubacterium sp.]|nr:RHS repeat-associated core domain-containing protein [Eubacterium sp.]
TSLDYEEQFRLGAFQLEKNTEYIEIRLVYSYQSGYADFDEIQLYKSNDDNVTFFNESEAETEPAALSDEETTVAESSSTITNDKGLTTAEITSDGNLSMVTQYTYDDNYYLKSFADTNNVTTEYEYDNANGTLKSLKIGDKETVYSYTPTGALKEVTRAVSGLTDNVANISASYTYNHDRITSIAHNGIKYNLTYNSFGNVKKVDLEVLSDIDKKSNLITYDYSKDFRQNLNSITYANGDILSYTYDDNNNITEIYFKLHSETESKLMYEYEYVDNSLSKIIDYDSNRITEYTSDGYKIYRPNPSGVEEDPILLYSISSTYNENDGTTVNNESLFGSDYTYTKYADSYSEENDETTYTSKSQFDYKVCSVNMNNNCVSDYFGRVKSSEMTVSYDLKNDIENSEENNTDTESETVNKTRSIKSTYTYKKGSEFNGNPTTTNLIDTFSTKISLLDNDSVETDSNKTNDDPEFFSSYKYDNAGRITHVYYGKSSTDMNLVSYYEYDTAGQLVTDAALHMGRITKYSYDSGGNITLKKIYDCDSLDGNSLQEILNNPGTPSKTIEYKYSDSSASALNGFSDLLTSYDGHSIEYDAIGNPTTYFSENTNSGPKDFILNWQGTLLKSIESKDGKSKYEYTYNQSGLRTQKTVYSDSNLETPSGTVSYIWQNDQLCGYQIITYDDNGVENGSINIKMLYDEYDIPIGIYLMSNLENAEQTSDMFDNDENIFWFVKDGQGNVVAMYSDTDKQKTLGCHYDGAGNLVIDTSGTFMDDIQTKIDQAMKDNPKWGWIVAILLAIAAGLAMSIILLIDQTAYRGYTYDFETGLYYCQNRYYSPSWGRFISMDDPAQLTLNLEEPLNANLYAYCYNDPVNNVDPNGRSSYSFTGVGMQAEMSACLLSFAGEVGIELIYTWTKNALYAYYYYGGGAGAGYTNKAINYLSSSFKDITMSSKVSLKNIANLFKLNYSISIGFFAAFTNKSFSWPNSYVGLTNSNSVSIGKWKGYRSTSSGCKTYGICYSPVGNSGFAFSKTTARYKKITFNSAKVKSYLSSQKNNIKKAVS